MPYKFRNISWYKLGEKGSGVRQRNAEAQDFYKLREQLLENGELFEDVDFEADNASLFYSQEVPLTFKWLRPTQIVDNPEFLVEGASRFDIKQGELGDCWLLAAIANLTLNEQLFSQVVPDDQGFKKDVYAGIFHFRFWQYGRWVDVVIDDRLPTVNDRLVYMRSSKNNEFWSALLEKAFAKLHGSYEALRSGGTSEAMEDFTGGVAEVVTLKEIPPNFYQIVLKCYERMSLMAGGIQADPNVLEAKTPQGLVKGHAYSVTKVQYIDIVTPNKSGKIPMLRLRNPWGNETEWNGAWSDKSPEWNFISDEEKERLGLTFEHDGEFWMSFKDFTKNFDILEICLLNPETLPKELRGDSKKRWETSTFEGEWARGVSAGGCTNHMDTFHCNPQYRITLEDPDENDDDNMCTVIIALMQKNRRALKKIGAGNLSIGFIVYNLENPDTLPKPLDNLFFRRNKSAARSSYVNLRESTSRFKLPPGDYCIVPTTYKPNEEGEFILRVCSEHKNNMVENDEEVKVGEIDDRVKDRQSDSEEEERKERARKFFKKFADTGLEIGWIELKEVLDNVMKEEIVGEGGFSKDVCRSMIAMMDVDRSGKLAQEEFKRLWTDIRSWQQVFKLYDTDNTGYLSPFDLRRALASAGYHLNIRILNILGHRYSSKNGEISFDDFIMCAVRLKSMMKIFQEVANKEKNTAEFRLEDWIETTLYS